MLRTGDAMRSKRMRQVRWVVGGRMDVEVEVQEERRSVALTVNDRCEELGPPEGSTHSRNLSVNDKADGVYKQRTAYSKR